MARLVIPNFTVIRDTREHEEGEGWMFDPSHPNARAPLCLGTEIATLRTGDYSMKGYEDIFRIERKAHFSELWVNYGERARFEREMERMTEFKYRYIIVESDLNPDVMRLSPPQFKTAAPGKALISWLYNLSLKYNIHIIPAGACGKQLAMLLMQNAVHIERDRWVPMGQRGA